jgi:hypothetical protein
MTNFELKSKNAKRMNSYFGAAVALILSLIGHYINRVYGHTSYWTYVFGLSAAALIMEFYYRWFKKKFIDKHKKQ